MILGLIPLDSRPCNSLWLSRLAKIADTKLIMYPLSKCGTLEKGIITKVIMISLTIFFLEDKNIQKGYDIKIEKRVVTNAITKDFKNIFIYTKSKSSLQFSNVRVKITPPYESLLRKLNIKI